MLPLKMKDVLMVHAISISDGVTFVNIVLQKPHKNRIARGNGIVYAMANPVSFGRPQGEHGDGVV